MNIQSLSIVVPTKNCWNKCEFCVSRMHHEDYGKSIIGENNTIPYRYLERIAFVREEGCNTMILTGTGEPQQNLEFISELLDKNFNELPKPFYNIAIQTTGSGLTDDDIKELAIDGVTTMAISTNSLDDEENCAISNMPKEKRVKLDSLIVASKENNMIVRLCYNMTSAFNKYSFDDLINYALERDVDQVTFRKIYASGNNDKINAWIANHKYNDFDMIRKRVVEDGKLIARLPYGFLQYSVKGISIVVDDDCMSKDNIEEMKYAILRPNGHLYSRWDDKGSLIF